MFRRISTRVRGLDEFTADAILAGVFALAGVVESLLVNSHGHSRPLTAIVAVVLSVPLAWRRRDTLLAVVAFVLILLAQSPLDTFVIDSLTTPFIGIMLLAYTAGRYEATRRLRVELGVAAAAINIPPV